MMFALDILYQMSLMDEYLGEDFKESNSKGSEEGVCFEHLRNIRKVNEAVVERVRGAESIRRWNQDRTLQWGGGRCDCVRQYRPIVGFLACTLSEATRQLSAGEHHNLTYMQKYCCCAVLRLEW